MTDVKWNSICISHSDWASAKIADNTQDKPVRIMLRHIILVHLNKYLQYVCAFNIRNVKIYLWK